MFIMMMLFDHYWGVILPLCWQCSGHCAFSPVQAL